MKLIGWIVVLLIILVGGYWLIAPLFIDEEVEEVLSPKVEQAIESALDKAGDGLIKAGEVVKNTEAEDIEAGLAAGVEGVKGAFDKTNLDEQITNEEEMKQFMEEMKTLEKQEDIVMEEPDPQDAEDEPTVISSGTFIDVAHEGSGDAFLISVSEEEGALLHFDNLDVLNGPDLRVYLSKNGDVKKASDLGDYIELGKLKGNKGNQSYALPSDISEEELSQFKSAVIYCKPFKVVFNSAKLTLE